MYFLAKKPVQKITILQLWCTNVTTEFFIKGYDPSYYYTLYSFLYNVEDVYLSEKLLHGLYFLLLFLDYPQDEWTLSFQEVNFFFFYLKCEILLSPRVKCMVSKLILYEHMALLFLAIFNILLSWNILLNFSEMPFV